MPSTSTLVDSIYTRRVSAGECYPPDLVKSLKKYNGREIRHKRAWQVDPFVKDGAFSLQNAAKKRQYPMPRRRTANAMMSSTGCNSQNRFRFR